MTEDQARAKLADKSWRFAHLYKIRTKDKRLARFKPNRAQADYLSHQTGSDQILKARQLGFTTLEALDDLDATITTPNTVSAIVAHKRDTVQKLFEIVRTAYENLPDLLRPKAGFDNKNELTFPEINSKIFVALDTRGETVHRLHVSEVAFMEDAEARMLGIMESVPKGGKISWESTGNGTSGKFYDTWNDKSSELTKHFYNWTWDDGYREETDKSLDELLGEYAGLAARFGLIPDLVYRFELTKEQLAWYMSKVNRLKDLVVQEYPTTDLEAFVASGRNVFHISDIQKHQELAPIARKWQDCLIWEEPLKDFKYVVGVDPSEGVGGDYAVIEVFNAHTGKQAAEYASNRTPADVLADLALDIAKHYNNAWMCPEVNNTGISFLDRIKGRYANIYRRQVMDQHTKEYHESLGWKTTGITKPLLIDNLEEAVRQEDIQISSEDALKELKVFVRTDTQGKQGYGAEGSNHDDRVIAMGLCVQMIKDLPAQKAPKTDAQKKLEEYIRAKQQASYMPNQPSTTTRFTDKRYSIRK